MGKTIDAATRTIHLQGMGRMPAVEAHELTVGDTLMWNEGMTTTVTKIVDASPQFLLVTQKNAGNGQEHARRMRKSRLVARVGRAEQTPTAPAERVDWWAVKDRDGNLISQVEATSYNHAVQVADQDPKVRAAAPGAGGLVFMRLASIPKPAPPSLPATPARFCTYTVPARRTVEVGTEFVGRSIPTRLRAAGAPGCTAMSSAGTLVWRLPNGEELTPGEASKRFLGD